MKALEAINHSSVQRPFSIRHKIAILTLLFAYFFSISVWISNPGPLKSGLLALITPLATPLSVLQSWTAFNQRETNYHETAVISFQDGSLKLYEFPRIQKLKYFKGVSSEQYRKVFFDYMPWSSYQDFLPDFAQFLVHANAEEHNQPTMVSLMHNWCYIPPPDIDNWCPPNKLPEHTNQRTYFVYASVPKDSK